MQRFYTDRESHGPEFDNRLIRLVRSNPAIYDVSHQHYRRNPVRVAIWDRIASELGAPSKFLQTKWKNIRYNYLQEIKCLETGHSNVNIRKRRFTEDLSFLQHTAQTYNVKKGTQKNASYNSSDNDNDSNSFLYLEPDAANAYEVIEIEHSDDDGEMEDISQPDFDPNDDYEDGDDKILNDAADNKNTPAKCSVAKASLKSPTEPTPEVTIEQKTPATRRSMRHSSHDTEVVQRAYDSSPSSPLLTPMVVMGNGDDGVGDNVSRQACGSNSNGNADSASLESMHNGGEIAHESVQRRAQRSSRVPPSEIMANAAKRKAAHAPFPVLQPINDPIELYCLSLVDTLRSMPRSERERVKFEFAKILKDASYKNQS